MINAIVDYLNQNVITHTFVRFGGGDLPCHPYGIVKTEKGKNGRNIRIILHDVKGNQEAIENSLRLVISLLEDKQIIDSEGKINRLGRLLDYTDVAVVSDDNTISMEALFLMPSTTF